MDKPDHVQSLQIVIADDDFEDFKLVKDIFKKVQLNLHLSHVEDGQYLIDILRAQSKNNKLGNLPHLILLDLNMPRKNGLEVLKEIKGDRLLCKIPVIIFTTSQTTRDIEQAYDLGASCYVCKPKTVDEWTSTLNNLASFWVTNVLVPMRS